MKSIYKNKAIACLVVAISMSAIANAQEFRTDVSTASQLKNNSVPGAKYASPAELSAKATPAKPFEGSSLAHQIKTGTLPGMKVAAGGGTAVPAAGKPAEKTAALPSDAAPQPETQAKVDVKPQLPPTQEEKPKEVKEQQ